MENPNFPNHLGEISIWQNEKAFYQQKFSELSFKKLLQLKTYGQNALFDTPEYTSSIGYKKIPLCCHKGIFY
ncbi:hypothetical protein [Salinimicrobium sp. GXAS 041]|uniref:hypothetical protein n=1 Tax=Salinimicrobium sp. GXAS 041 TaxID=3400806 RepID=UPI003C755AC9